MRNLAQKNGVVKSATSNESERVMRTAFLWWRNHRPITWGEAEHLKNPTINCSTEELQLARAVAAWVKAYPLHEVRP